MARVNLKVGISGVRGIVGDSLTPPLVADFAAAFGEYSGGGRIVIGRDTRPSGQLFERAVVAGLLSVGCQPLISGIVPTPTVQILVDEYKGNGGIVISASHNSSEWNALKFIGQSGIFLNHVEAAELLNIYNQSDRNYAVEDEYREVRMINNPFEIHKNRIFKSIDIQKIRGAKLKIAVDCCNGAGLFYAKDFFEELGCEVIVIFDEPDGIFRREPEPIAKNLGELRKTILKNNCDIGFAFDPDADRIVMISPDGEPIGEQYSIVLAAEHVLSKNPGSPVVINVQTTKAVNDVAKKYNSPVFLSPVGEINVTSKMLEVGAIIGGEGGSGGVIFPKVHPCRDSFTAAALILEMMAERGQSLPEILAKIPRYCETSAKIPCSGAEAVNILRKLKEHEKYKNLKTITIDGLRFDWDDSWALIRNSNTEPIIRVFVESSTQEKVAHILDEFKNIFNEVKSEI